MLGGDRDKKLVERPDDEPGYNKHNKTDRRLVLMFTILGGIALLIALTVILIYVFLF